MMTLALAALITSATAAQQAGPVSPRGLYQAGTRPGVKLQVLLVEASREQPVPLNHRFRTGDRLRLRLELNHQNYVYVLNRTVRGDPAGREEPRLGRPTQYSEYRLVYPIGGAGDVRLAAAKPQSLPVDRSYFEMDQEAGVEKVLIVVSPQPLRFRQYFDPQSGRWRYRPEDDSPRPAKENPPKPAPPTRPSREDTEAAVLKRLEDQLRTSAQNVEASVAGITEPVAPGEEPNSYAVSKDPSQPLMLEITLSHYPR
jgi:hypothetical protein